MFGDDDLARPVPTLIAYSDVESTHAVIKAGVGTDETIIPNVTSSSATAGYVVALFRGRPVRIPSLGSRPGVALMDNQTRFGIGGIAASCVLTFLMAVWPTMPQIISIPALMLSLAAAGYGFWPWLRELPSRLSLDRLRAVIEAARLQMAAWSVSEWDHPRDAAERFAPSDWISEKREQDEKIDRLRGQHWEIRGKMADAMKTMPKLSAPIAIPEPEEMEGLRAELQECQSQSEAAQRRSNTLYGLICSVLLEELKAGSLLAKGLPKIGGVAQAEHVIPPYKWRVMALNVSDAEASGHGWQYVGIVIGQPKQNRTDASSP